MKLKRCVNKHFYDGEKYEKCPHCNNESESNKGTVEFPKDRPVYHEDSKKIVTGWLVGVDGVYYGQSFELYEGTNVVWDSMGAEEEHSEARIVYDSAGNSFAVSCQASAAVYLNEVQVIQPVPLNSYDTIGVGNSRFLFVALCSERFHW